MQQTLVGGTAVSEISSEELALVSGGQYAAIQPSAVGTSGALQALIVAKLEVLGNPIAGGGGH
jgi:hypothetical protein